MPSNIPPNRSTLICLVVRPVYPVRQERKAGGERGAAMLSIEEDDLSSKSTRALLAQHLRGMNENSPPGAVFALDISGLNEPGVTLWTAKRDGEAIGMAALKQTGDGVGELKSMRTRTDALRQGVGAALLDHVIAEARRRGLKRLSLETGSGPAFEAALALYRKRGFQDGPAFGGYEKSAFNQFLHLEVEQA
ncbi:MAG: GNAT family N-acetyltransferase [Rhodoblastus sp.]